MLTLALGIAATTTVFGWIDGMVLHPFRGADARTIFLIPADLPPFCDRFPRCIRIILDLLCAG